MAYSSKGQKIMRIIGSKSYIISNIYWKSKILFLLFYLKIIQESQNGMAILFKNMYFIL